VVVAFPWLLNSGAVEHLHLIFFVKWNKPQCNRRSFVLQSEFEVQRNLFPDCELLHRLFPVLINLRMQLVARRYNSVQLCLEHHQRLASAR
jgi:hypothetical protein